MDEKMRVAKRMVEIVRTEPDIAKLLKENPIEGIVAVSAKAEKVEEGYDRQKDHILYRISICVLGVIALGTAASAIVFGLQEKTIPEVLVALGSASVGSLVGLFAPSPVGKD